MNLDFQGTIWNVLAHPDRNIIFLEIRNESLKKVSFSAYDLDSKECLFKDLTFEEPWWISQAEASGNVLIFTIYTDTNNPDQKSILAFDFMQNKTIWWRNKYAVAGVNGTHVLGSETGLGMKFLALNLSDGLPAVEQPVPRGQENFLIRKPLQYYQETSHFETVKSFLSVKYQISAISLIEYLELNSLMFISYYVSEGNLANYLLVLNAEGEILLQEKIGSALKGIGLDTFFILSGYLIFEKNRRELVSYKMV
jgi:hypothetical protein